MTKEIDVIHQVLQGDVDSFRLLVQRYQKPIISMIKNIINDQHMCEDVAQDVFLTAYTKLASFDPARSNFSTWLFTITKNKSLNALKKKRALSMSQLPEKADSCNPSDELGEKELFNELDRELQTLFMKACRLSSKTFPFFYLFFFQTSLCYVTSCRYLRFHN